MTIVALKHTPTRKKTLEQRLANVPIGQTILGSQIYAWTLRLLEMDKVMVYIGGPIIDIVDRIEEEVGGIEVLMGPDEVDIGHIAEGHYKVTKKPLNVLFTSGVAVKASSPVADAKGDGVGLIVTVGQVPYEALDVGDEWFQSAKIIEPFRHWSKWAYRIPSAEMIQSALKTAYYVATTGRPGPVVLELAVNISQNQTAVLKNLDKVPQIRVRYKKPKIYSLVKVEKTSLDSLREDMVSAQRPVIIAGGGVHYAGGVGQLLKYAQMTDTPVETTLMLRGAIQNNNPDSDLNLNDVMDRLCFEFPGMHGSAAAQLAVHNSDVLVGIGNRWDNRITLKADQFAPDATIYWINPHYPGINKFIAGRVRKIDMDAKEALEVLIKDDKTYKHDRWINQIKRWQQEYPMPTHVPREVIQLIREFTRIYEPKEPYVATGVGSHQMFFAQYWNFFAEDGKNMLLTSGALAPMGVGVPYGFGALIAEPDRPVYVFNGDGSAVMDSRSLLMGFYLRKRLKQYKNGLKEIVFRDNTLGMVRHWQKNMWKDRIHASDLSKLVPSNYFRGLAKANEFKYFRVDYIRGDPNTNKEVIELFVRYRGNAMLEVILSPEGVFPMTPGTKSVKDIILPYGQVLKSEDLLVAKNW